MLCWHSPVLFVGCFCLVKHVVAWQFVFDHQRASSILYFFICWWFFFTLYMFIFFLKPLKFACFKSLMQTLNSFHAHLNAEIICKQTRPHCTTWDLFKCSISSSLNYSKHAFLFIITISKHELQFSLSGEPESLFHAERLCVMLSWASLDSCAWCGLHVHHRANNILKLKVWRNRMFNLKVCLFFSVAFIVVLVSWNRMM